MPLVKYKCEQGHVYRRILLADLPSIDVCKCGSQSKRVMSNFGLGGQIFFDLMQAESTLLGSGSSERFNDSNDVRAWEKNNGVVQCTAKEQREYREYTTDQAVDQHKTIVNEGREAWFDRGDKEEIQQSNGWNDSQYNRWKEVSDEYESRNDKPKAT